MRRFIRNTHIRLLARQVSLLLCATACVESQELAPPTTPIEAPEEGDTGGDTPLLDETWRTLAYKATGSYDTLQAGVITPSTLLSWRASWDEQRPAGLTGDLVVLQYNNARDGEVTQLKAAQGVRVYQADDLPSLIELRSNGLLATSRAPARGLTTDIWLRRYQIDPQRDMIVLAGNHANEETLTTLSQAWLAMRYWGVPHSSLAILNSPITELDGDELQNFAISPPEMGGSRVTSLPQLNTILLSDISELFYAQDQDVHIIDVRTLEEYQGARLSVSRYDGSCAAGRGFCSGGFSGHIKGGAVGKRGYHAAS